MLVLSMRVGDVVVIGESGDILVTMLTNGVGFTAPRTVPIDRWKVRQDVESHGRRRTLG